MSQQSRRIYLSALALANGATRGARISIFKRNFAVWPRDCDFLATDYLANRHPFPQDSHITFVEDTHKYYIDGIEAEISVTGLAHAPFEAFDTRAVLGAMTPERKMSKYNTTSDKEIAKQWEANGKLASELGTKMHAALEIYLNTMYWSKDPSIQMELSMAKTFFEKEIVAKGWEVYRTEPTIFINDPTRQILLAGSVDCICRDPRTDEFIIMDWKRSKGIDITADGRFGWGTCEGFESLENLNYSHYSLQLHIYRYIFMHCYGKQISSEHLYIVVFHPMNDSYKILKAHDVSEQVSLLMDTFPIFLNLHKEHEDLKKATEKWLNS